MSASPAPKKVFHLLAALLLLGALVLARVFKPGTREAAPPVREEVPEEEFSGEVVRVLDGDTVEVMRKGRAVRIRLHGVDCPEKGQAFGTQAKNFTSELVFGQSVRVAVRDQDKYGRLVGEVSLPGEPAAARPEQSLNAELVQAGLAWAYRHYSMEYVPVEEEARAAKRGLWSDPAPEPPWDFRHKEHKAGLP